MNRLVLYSDQIAGQSDGLDDALMALLDGTRFRIAFVPAQSDRKRRYFEKACDHYAALGIPDVLHCDVDAQFDAAVWQGALACDAIHLGSGETAPFLAAIARRGLTSDLRLFLERGGVLIGVSAGAMVLTGSGPLCDFMDKSASGPRGRSKKQGFVDFDFFPHFDGDAPTRDRLLAYSKATGRRLYACHDSEGIIVDGDAVRLVGRPLHIEAGRIADFIPES